MTQTGLEHRKTVQGAPGDPGQLIHLQQCADEVIGKLPARTNRPPRASVPPDRSAPRRPRVTHEVMTVTQSALPTEVSQEEAQSPQQPPRGAQTSGARGQAGVPVGSRPSEAATPSGNAKTARGAPGVTSPCTLVTPRGAGPNGAQRGPAARAWPARRSGA